METKEQIIERSRKYAQENRFQLNPKKEIVDSIALGLMRNREKHGQLYCPCRKVTGDVTEDAKKICPCFWHRQELEKDGHCLCYLFTSK